MWPRATATARALGANDTEDVKHAAPIFPWEVARGLRTFALPNLWLRCAAALLAISCLAARRRSGAQYLLVGQAKQIAPNAVMISPRHRPKPQHERATRRPRRQPRSVVIQHWMVEYAVIPWLMWHAANQSPPTAKLFPSITHKSPKPTTLGFRSAGMWVEPMRTWTGRPLSDCLSHFIFDRNGRTWQGLRVGNNIELLRHHPDRTAGTDGVSDATRMTLHERSLRRLVGSEVAYREPFAEDLALATERLGQLKIERHSEGLCTVVATSESRGRYDDYTPLPQAISFAPAPPPPSDSSDSSSTEDAAAQAPLVGDGGDDTRTGDCGRCGLHLGEKDYGFLCDMHEQLGCTWMACPDCHTGGHATKLLCPDHSTT